jgi:hypothetical protein
LVVIALMINLLKDIKKERKYRSFI